MPRPKKTKVEKSESVVKADSVVAADDDGPTPVSPPVSDAGKVKKPTHKQPSTKKPLLMLDGSSTAPVTVRYEGSSTSVKNTKGSDFTLSLKLYAADLFSVDKTVLLSEDGPYQGLQAILLRPAAPFPFLKLPEELRVRIYQDYFAPEIDPHSGSNFIEVDAKRVANREVWAKKYAHGSKNRVGLLAVCKEIYHGAVGTLYSNSIRFETTSYLVDFLSQVPPKVRHLLQGIRIHSYQHSSARTAFNLLADAAPNITRLTIEVGLASDPDVKKAAKSFMNAAGKYLEASVQARGGDAKEAMNVLRFQKHALAIKDGCKLKAWSKERVAEFRDAIVEKMK